jgi:hypothetical protein
MYELYFLEEDVKKMRDMILADPAKHVPYWMGEWPRLRGRLAQ